MSGWNMTFLGRSAVKAASGVRVLAALCRPNNLVVTMDSLSARRLLMAKLLDDDPVVSTGVADIVNDLAVLQPHVPATLVLPRHSVSHGEGGIAPQVHANLALRGEFLAA